MKTVGTCLNFQKVSLQNIRSEEKKWGGVGDKNVATGDLLVSEHFLPQPLGAAAECSL